MHAVNCILGQTLYHINLEDKSLREIRRVFVIDSEQLTVFNQKNLLIIHISDIIIDVLIGRKRRFSFDG